MVWIPLSHFLFYGFYQSLTYKEVKKVGIRTIFFRLWTIMNLFGSQIFPNFAENLLHSAIRKQAFIALVCIIFAKWSKQLAVSAERQEQLYIMNLKTECLWVRYFK